MKVRIKSLDSIRGLAALLVVFLHSWTGFNNCGNLQFYELFCGTIPVMIFFVLSGFVLTNSLSSVQSTNYYFEVVGFYIRRIFRIIPLTLASLIFSLILSKYYSESFHTNYAGDSLKYVIGRIVKTSPHVDIWDVILLNKTYLNPPLWTIRPELICSALLPFAVCLVNSKPKSKIPILLISALFLYLNGSSGWSFSLAYFFAFYLGTLVFMYQKELKKFNKKQCAITIGGLMSLLVTASYFKFNNLIIISLFSSGVILLGLWEKQFVILKILESPLLVWLGKISFSLYLLHVPIVLWIWSQLDKHYEFFFQINPPYFVKSLFVLLVLSISLTIAHFSEKYLERPSNNFGHKLSKRFQIMIKPHFACYL